MQRKKEDEERRKRELEAKRQQELLDKIKYARRNITRHLVLCGGGTRDTSIKTIMFGYYKR